MAAARLRASDQKHKKVEWNPRIPALRLTSKPNKKLINNLVSFDAFDYDGRE